MKKNSKKIMKTALLCMMIPAVLMNTPGMIYAAETVAPETTEVSSIDTGSDKDDSINNGSISTGSENTDSENKDTIIINSMEDYKSFAKKCRANVWSNGITVNLNTDLDFSDETTFPTISYFNGTFLGNDHKILNVRSGNPMLRTIGPAGTVQNLELSSVVTSERDKTAAFVSENYGLVENITVKSNVSGKTTTGILSALNGDTGVIRGCHVSGSLEGDNATGAIAGRNEGLIEDCSSSARVNTSVRESSVSTEDIKDILENILITKNINNVENFKNRVDTGGIAGYNLRTGTIRNCESTGDTGYSHIGYNTGGITGRNGGAIENSVNKGSVFGRKDTGGIAGQQQPEITVDFSKDVLTSLSDEIDQISVLVTDTLNTTEGMTNSTYDRLNGISRTLTEVKNSTNTMYNASLERFDELAETINSTTDILLNAVGDIGGDMDYLDDSLDDLSRMSDNLSASIDDLAYAFSMSDAEKNALIAQNNQLREDLNYSSAFVAEAQNHLLPEVPEARQARVNEGATRINRLLGNVRATRTMLEGLRRQRELIANGTVQTDFNRRSAALNASVSNILDSLGDMDNASAGLSKFSSSLGGTLTGISNGININVKSSPVIRAAGDKLYAQLDSLSAQLDSLSAFGRDDSMEVLNNLSEINRRFSSITDLLKNERDRLNNIADNGGVFNDTSAPGNSTSRIIGCKNAGNVSGDIGVGGIAGTIGIEYDLDPEKDIIKSNDRSLDYSFGASAILMGSENLANVEGRGNYTGGICGKLEIGYLSGNQNTGDVKSESGHFVGGIAGYSDGTLDQNTARCRITGEKNVGGIAGYGTTLTYNSAAVTILGDEEYAGSVAGKIDKLDSDVLWGNVYYGGNYGAIDNIDYAGMAEESPAPLGTLLVKFMLGGNLIDIKEAAPGTLLKDVEFPEVEEKEGFFIQWDQPLDTVIEDDIVVNASYYLPVALLNAPQNYMDSSKPVLIVDGQFMEEDVLGFSMPEENHYIVEIPEDGLSERKIRVHKPEWKNYSFTVNGNVQATEDFGDYLIFVTGERKLDIQMIKDVIPWRDIAKVVGGIALVILLITLVNRFRKKKQPKKNATEKS
ncbi:GLUG motif-containing protein [Oribacterium sp. FC2011]|uniref:GLUG motif-containing protein n=1 Tax=Oribacterium sp. FC2011 TaxID=1408311 RepID=UPI0004E2406A|nr:GLUG motif-containing protein [Oribacterium sp. FC2011]